MNADPSSRCPAPGPSTDLPPAWSAETVTRRRVLQRVARVGHAAGVLALLGPLPQPVQAQSNGRAEGPGVDIRTLNLRREDGAVLLDFDLQVNLPATVEEALRRGVPLYFQAQATLFRYRWYWRDARVARVERLWRLSYQPLTSVYRVSLGAISQSHNRLEDAMASVTRLGRWVVAEAGQAEAGERHYAEFVWRLDTTQLPRPMQFGLGAGGEWSLGVERTLRLES